MVTGEALNSEFLRVARRGLEQHFAKIQKAVAKLDESQLWGRAHENENAVGNLLMHLAGNVRQWIICGLGGEEDRRDRDGEFAQREALPAKELLAKLRRTVEDADRVIAALTPEQLMERHNIQGYQVTGLYAVFHVVDHFGEHTGQIIWIAKNRSGDGLGFFKHLSGGGKAEGGEPGIPLD